MTVNFKEFLYKHSFNLLLALQTDQYIPARIKMKLKVMKARQTMVLLEKVTKQIF